MPAALSGHIELLPSGSYRVHVYAGTDPVTGKPRRIRRTCKTEAKAAQELANLLRDAETERSPDDAATFGMALDRYLEVADLEVSTLVNHKSYIRRIIRPVLGDVRIRKIGPDTLDGLYSHLKKCSRLCRRLPRVEHLSHEPHVCDERCGPLRDHRTPRAHACDARCQLHQCVPLGPASIVKVHSIISAAMNLAVRYEWIDRNPAERASPPSPPKGRPDPPSPRAAVQLLNHVRQLDEEFGLFLWLAMVTGARRGELLALRESRFDFELAEIALTRNFLVKDGQRIEKDTKTGEGRRVSADPLTCEMVADFLARRRKAAAQGGVQVPDTAFLFSPDPLGAQPWNPDTMTHRYERYAAVVGIASPLKELRHYSATQLLSSGVDLRTVAGRLGHAEGSTTLRFYAQFVRPADQHAAAVLSNRLIDMRKKERLRELFAALPSDGHNGNAHVVAHNLAAEVDLEPEAALNYLREFGGL